MKATKILFVFLLSVGLVSTLFADLEAGRPLESNSLIWRPEKAAREETPEEKAERDYFEEFFRPKK